MAKKQDGSTRKDVFAFVGNNYGTSPEYIFSDKPNFAVLRHPIGKWYAIVMDVDRSLLGLSGHGKSDVINVKCSPDVRDALCGQKGFLPAYHMNKEHWLTFLLDGSVPHDVARFLIDASYGLVAAKTGKMRSPCDLLIPIPSDFDTEAAFEGGREADFPAYRGATEGDNVWLFRLPPISETVCKCQVLKADRSRDESSSDGAPPTVKLRMIKTLKTPIGPSVLKEHGIHSVRSPRKIPYSLRYILENAE